MGRVVIVAYRPKPGKADELAADGTIVEAFEFLAESANLFAEFEAVN